MKQNFTKTAENGNTFSASEMVKKNAYMVTFKYAEGIYCTNLAMAETAGDVERAYSKYTWSSVSPAKDWEVRESMEKGRPVIDCPHVTDRETYAEPEQAEPEQKTGMQAGRPAQGPQNRAERRAADHKPVRRVNSPKTLKKLLQGIRDALEQITPEMLAGWHVCVSSGNDKIKDCGNVLTAPVFTCTGCCGSCCEYCYAVRCYNRQGNDPADTLWENPWFRNTAILILDRARYFAEIAEAIRENGWKYFRWHVSGEITDPEYFAEVVKIAELFPAVRFLIFTKQHGYVNAYPGAIPQNLKVILSAAPGLCMDNPRGLPEAHINFADPEKNTCQHAESMRYHCPGNCETCRCAGAGCWFLENGAAVVFDQH